MPDPLRTGCVANFHIPPDLETISITDEAYLLRLALFERPACNRIPVQAHHHGF